MGRSQLSYDLSRNLQNRLAETFERELKIAGQVLDGGEIGSLIFDAAVMMVRSSAASIGAMAEPPATPAEVYQMTVDAIFEAEKIGRDAAIGRAAGRLGGPI